MRCLVIGVVGAVLALPGATWADEADEQVADVIQKLGGLVDRRAEIPGRPICAINLKNPEVTDAQLKGLVKDFGRLKALDSLFLVSVKVTDEGLKELAALKDLKDLTIAFHEVTDEGLKELKTLKSLRRLSIQCRQITDGGVKELLPALKELVHLRLNRTQVTDASL